MATILRTVPLLVCLVFLLAACKPAAAPEPATRPAPATSPAAQPGARPAPPDAPETRDPMPGSPDAGLPKRDTTPVDTKVTEVRLSNKGNTEQHTLGMPTSTFGSKDTVYAEVQTTGTAPAYTLYAKWIAADGTVLADYGMRLNEPALKRTVISLSKSDGWPRGENKIELAINGNQQRTVAFMVR